MGVRWAVLAWLGVGLLAVAWCSAAANAGQVGATGVDVTVITQYEPAPTAIRCPNGDVIGSTAECPLYVVPGGPTPTVDGRYVNVLSANGATYPVYRGFTYGEIAIASLVLVIACVLGLAWLVRAGRGG